MQRNGIYRKNPDGANDEVTVGRCSHPASL